MTVKDITVQLELDAIHFFEAFADLVEEMNRRVLVPPQDAPYMEKGGPLEESEGAPPSDTTGGSEHT